MMVTQLQRGNACIAGAAPTTVTLQLRYGDATVLAGPINCFSLFSKKPLRLKERQKNISHLQDFMQFFWEIRSFPRSFNTVFPS
jgi:hypothetical protein